MCEFCQIWLSGTITRHSDGQDTFEEVLEINNHTLPSAYSWLFPRVRISGKLSKKNIELTHWDPLAIKISFLAVYDLMFFWFLTRKLCVIRTESIR